jgi:hypothetical protein
MGNILPFGLLEPSFFFTNLHRAVSTQFFAGILGFVVEIVASFC